MRRMRWTLPLVLGLGIASEGPAQFFPPVIPVIGVPVLVPNGIGFQYSSRRLGVSGFFGNGYYTPGIMPIAATGGFPLIPGQRVYLYTPGYFPQFYNPYGIYPYGAQTSSVTLQIINPSAVGNVRRALGDEYDIEGIDLDVQPAARVANRNEMPPQPGKMKAAQKELLARAAELALQNDAPPKPAAPPAPKPPANVAEAPAAAAPKVEPVPPGKRLVNLGTTAFEAGDYGLAILRFRQAALENAARAMFLQAQACLAVGKYDEAVDLIRAGLRRDPAWPQGGFNPRAELYGNDAARFQQHFARLERMQRDQPKDANVHFLRGYIAWFDGDRAGAVAHFQQAEALGFDAPLTELFLKVK